MKEWIKRSYHNIRTFNKKRRGVLTGEEIDLAEIFVQRAIQKDFLNDNCKRIKTLNSVIDEFGILRLNTRISERLDTMNFRLLIVLPGKHPVVRELILDLHQKSRHIRTQGLLNLIRKKYSTLSGGRLTRSILNQCGVCKSL